MGSTLYIRVSLSTLNTLLFIHLHFEELKKKKMLKMLN